MFKSHFCKKFPLEFFETWPNETLDTEVIWGKVGFLGTFFLSKPQLWMRVPPPPCPISFQKLMSNSVNADGVLRPQHCN